MISYYIFYFIEIFIYIYGHDIPHYSLLLAYDIGMVISLVCLGFINWMIIIITIITWIWFIIIIIKTICNLIFIFINIIIFFVIFEKNFALKSDLTEKTFFLFLLKLFFMIKFYFHSSLTLLINYNVITLYTIFN